MSEQTFQIDGYPFRARQFPKPKVDWGVTWIASKSKNKHASDRGAGQDIYETEFTLYDQEAYLNAWQVNLAANARGVVGISGFGESIFAPNVDHTGSINCAIKVIGFRKATAFVAGGSEMYEMNVHARAISPPLLSTTPSLATLRMQHGFEADKSYEARTGFSYDQHAFTTDTGDDIGVYNGVFLQTTAELQAILAYIFGVARASVITLPSVISSAVPYPFGIVRGAGPFQSRITKFTFSRRDFLMWNLGITFAEHA